MASSVALAVWIILWRVKFKVMENVVGVLGLSMLVFAVAFVMLAPPVSDTPNTSPEDPRQ